MKDQKQRLSKEKVKQLDQMYEELFKLNGIGNQNLTDASMTIDEMLYGEMALGNAAMTRLNLCSYVRSRN